MSDPLLKVSGRPALRLVSFDAEPAPRRRRRARSPRRRGFKSFLAAAVVLGTAGIVGVRMWTAPAPTPVLVTRTVEPGDTLWSLADRYGDPNKSMLDRIDHLSRTNRLVGGSSLVPGQRLVIPVENPVEVALIQKTVATGDQRRE